MDSADNVNFWDLGDIRLRAARTSDAAMFAEHFESSPRWVERAFDRLEFPRTAADAGHWLAGYFSGGDETGDAKSSLADCRVFIIEETVSRAFIGYIDVWEADARNGVFKTGIKMLGGYAGKGFATRAYAKVLEFYFDELRYQKCDIYIYEFNAASLRFHKKFGFVEEGRLRREYYSGGRLHDSVCLGLTAEEYSAAGRP
jgi:RimJ/RimL family protein N-acetyltransferase